MARPSGMGSRPKVSLPKPRPYVLLGYVCFTPWASVQMKSLEINTTSISFRAEKGHVTGHLPFSINNSLFSKHSTILFTNLMGKGWLLMKRQSLGEAFLFCKPEDSNCKGKKSQEGLDHCAVSFEILEEKAPQSVGDSRIKTKGQQQNTENLIDCKPEIGKLSLNQRKEYICCTINMAN
ncbi:hypothetical protein WISP_104682 [Willisornis vidua]|uniref:Uncharacterized protein n=1 Tax=Willisornis vidua TaxID=1566151 RepID=A0ABQ9D091_9PASS|nr:hypothetical protein WISP_104682 [Willisornis vidua]